MIKTVCHNPRANIKLSSETKAIFLLKSETMQNIHIGIIIQYHFRANILEEKKSYKYWKIKDKIIIFFAGCDYRHKHSKILIY